MNEYIKQFLEESIALELYIGDLYQQFSVKFTEASDFWWKLSIEELNHAALIESINDVFLSENLINSDSIENQINELKEMNLQIKQHLDVFRQGTPQRDTAFQIAFEIENSIGEYHFELFMTAQPDSTMMKIMQKLNGDDVNHANRLKQYMKATGLTLP